MTQTVAISGLGAIGWPIAQALDQGIPGVLLIAVGARRRAVTEARVSAFDSPPRIVSLAELCSADILIETTPSDVFLEVVRPAIQSRKTILVMSAGALLRNITLVDEARTTGARIFIPSGAIAGLDAVRAASEGTIYRLILETRKLPLAFCGAPWVLQQEIYLSAIRSPRLLFSGNALEAVEAFPANANVAAALALSGPGFERTEVRIWADPTLTCNVHRIQLESDSVNLDTTIKALVSATNPKTSGLAAYCAIAFLRSVTSCVKLT